jgi:hypothetical protein
LGPLARTPPTGRRFRVRTTAYFIFDTQENLVCERIYFDTATLLKQLLGGFNVKNPCAWPTLVRALRGLSTLSAEPNPSLLNTTAT